MMDMDSIFRQLEKAGKANVENLLQWMKDSNIIKATEKDARKIFKDVANQHHVELDQFKNILAKVAAEKSKSVAQLSKQLAAEGPMFIDAVIAGPTAIRDAFNVAAK